MAYKNHYIKAVVNKGKFFELWSFLEGEIRES